MGSPEEGSKTRIQVLSAHTFRKEAACGGRVQMETIDSRHRADYAARQGRLTCGGGGGSASATSSVSSIRISRRRPPSNRRVACRPRKHATLPNALWETQFR